MPGITVDPLVSLRNAKFDAFELTPRICLRSTQWSLSTAFFSFRSLRKSLGTNFLVKKVLLPTSQLYVLSHSLTNTLRFLYANLLVLPSRVYINPLAQLQSSWMFTLKFPLNVIIVPRYGYSLQISRGSFFETETVYLSRGLSFFHNHDFCLFIIDSEFPLLSVCLQTTYSNFRY